MVSSTQRERERERERERRERARDRRTIVRKEKQRKLIK